MSFPVADIYRLAIEGARDGVWVIDTQGVTILTNEALHKILGYTAEQMLGRSLMDFMTPERRSYAIENLRRRDEGVAEEHDFVFLHRDGFEVPTHLSTSPLYDAEGGRIGACAFVTDLKSSSTAQRSTQESLHAFERLAASIPDCLWRARIDADGQMHVDYLSPSFERIWGQSPEPILRDSTLWMQAVVEEDRQALQATIAELEAGGARTTTYRIRRPDGEIRRIEETMSFDQSLPDGSHILDGVSRDITERLRLEQRLQDSQRHESLAVMAAGVAHDFNNLLVSMLGQASFIRASLPLPQETLAEELCRIEEAAEQAANLCRQLLAYAGAGRLQRKAVDISTLIEESKGLIAATVNHQIRVDFRMQENLPMVRADVNQLRQVLLNIIKNAGEAVVPGQEGRAVIRTGLRTLSESEARNDLVEQIEPGPYVFIEVEDDGMGMDESTRSKLFDPFFTTRFIGRGLGMASVLGIVRAHRGGIAVRSELTKGACVTVLLPSMTPVRPAPDPDQALRRILLVDDDLMVARVATNLLQRMQFEVTHAPGGREALEIWGRRSKDFDVLVVDLTMPGMSGPETLSAMQGHGPLPPTLLMSGYTDEDAAERLAGIEVPYRFLAKPFTMKALGGAIGALLDDPPG